MSAVDTFQIIMLVMSMLFLSTWLFQIIFEKVFIKLNYKKLIQNGSNCEYEDVKKEFRKISDYFNLMPGDFKFVYMDETLTIVKMNKGYYQFDGSNLNFMFCEKCLILNELEERILSFKSEEE